MKRIPVGSAAALVLAMLSRQMVGAEELQFARVDNLRDHEFLRFDENDRLATHALVFDATNPNCQAMEKLFGTLPYQEEGTVRIAGVEGAARDEVFQGHQPVTPESCQAACLEKGVPKSLVGSVMPEKIYDSRSPSKGSHTIQSPKRWFADTCTRVEVCVLSYHSKTSDLIVYWKEPTTGNLLPHQSLPYGEKHTKCFYSYWGHEFVAKDSKTEEVVGTFTVETTSVMAWGDSPPSDRRSDNYDYEREILSTLKHEWTRHQRITRTFSPLGFKKGRLPNDVFASMSAFYYNNAQRIVREEWKARGVFVNWWETDVFFLQIPWDLKNSYQGRLRVMVEEWAGVPVEQTVMYGLRQYTEGARLLTHVDRHTTHAVSLIVNVAQGNLTEPWPVEVQDHANRLHEVIMEPGDVVYYESAKCLHGRNRPMVGPNAYYVNLFTHYRPTGDPNWFGRPNPENTPEAVLGTAPVEDECQLVSKGLTSAAGSLGLVEAVECSNPQLGPYVSPALFQASGPEDLIRWWRTTGGESDPKDPDAVSTHQEL